jgi:Ig-like domain from next to BRCA1 gene
LSDARHESGGGEAAPARRKTILLPGSDKALRSFIAAECPVPVDVVSNPAAPLSEFDLAVLVVESVEPPLRAAVTRVLTDGVAYVVLVRRDVWSAATSAVRKLLDEVQRDPRRKLIRFWHDRDDLERTLRDEVFTLDDAALVSLALRDGAFVEVGSTFEQTWKIENTGFRVWEDRSLQELASEHARPERRLVPIPRTEPGASVDVSVRFKAPDEPASCRSVWQMVDADGRNMFPWAPGMRCQVLAVY